MIPKVSRTRIKEGTYTDYGFNLIAPRPSYSECKLWGISLPKGDTMLSDEIYNTVLKYVRQYAVFDVPEGFIEDFKLHDRYLHADVLTPERVARAYIALLRTESYESMLQFKIDKIVNGKSYSIIPNVPIRDGKPRHMAKGCIAFGRAMISAYAGIIANKDQCRKAAWSEEYCLELGVKCFMLKYKSCVSNNRFPYLDCALQAYHDWSYGSDIKKGLSQKYYQKIKAFYLKYLPESIEAPQSEVIEMNIKNELGKIGVRGGHAVGDNVLPSIYGYPAYNEGEYVHNLSQRLSEEFGFDNLETETVKLKWATIAKRGRDAGCDTILYNHTNFSLNSKGTPNSGTVTIIYPFENDKYKNMYKRMAEIIAQHMNLPRSEVRIRMSTEYENKNYYSAIHYGMKYGIKHPLIIEYGYHVDVAGREDERTEQIIAAYKDMLEVENDSPAVPPADETHEEPVEAVDYEWLTAQLNAGIKVFEDIKKAFGLED